MILSPGKRRGELRGDAAVDDIVEAEPEEYDFR